jgi:hypothetical protein
MDNKELFAIQKAHKLTDNELGELNKMMLSKSQKAPSEIRIKSKKVSSLIASGVFKKCGSVYVGNEGLQNLYQV